MSDPDSLAHRTGVAAPSHRPRRTLTGALVTVALALTLVFAAVEPVLVAAAVTALLTGVGLGRLLQARSAGRRGRRRCLPGTGLCVTY